jgi:hypothetical protein
LAKSAARIEGAMRWLLVIGKWLLVTLQI